MRKLEFFVDDRSPESLESARKALMAKMRNHNGQEFDRIFVKLSSWDCTNISVEERWKYLSNYMILSPEEAEEEEKKGNRRLVKAGTDQTEYRGGVGYYCLMLNFDRMGLPWPDGYSSIDGEAPVYIDNDTIRYAYHDKFLYLKFGFSERAFVGECSLGGLLSNLANLPAALFNKKIAEEYDHVKLFIDFIEALIWQKHGTVPIPANRFVEAISSFNEAASKMAADGHNYYLGKVGEDANDPLLGYGFSIYRDDDPIYLEDFLDLIRY